jgi:type III restriction enzyme
MEELQRLIYSPIRQELTDYEARFKRISTDIRSCYEKKLQKKLINAEIEKNDLELKSLTEQVEKLRKGLKGISDDDRNIIESHANFDIYDQLIDGWKAELSSTSESIDLVIKELSAYPTPIPLESTLPDKEQKLVEQMHQEIRAIFSSAQTSLNILKDKLNGKDENLEKFNETLASWQLILDQHNKKYNSAKEKSSSQEVTLKEIQKLEKRDKEVRKSLSEKKQKLSKIGNPEVKFESLKEEWLSAHRERADQIEYQCSQLERLSDNNIRASIGRGKGTKAIVESLKGILLGSKFRNDKINDICSFVSNEENPIQTWHQLLLEFEELANFDMEIGNNTLPLTPILKKSGLISNDISKIADKMNPENWINLFLVEIVDLPRFEYKTRDGEYIEFSDASAGQQATALIHVLLNQEGPPLIIDQPEDDLDNQMVSEIADLICKSKNQRQLIFTSHNANIVVNGDAELVICCDYKVTGDQSKGEIRGEGAIDIADIRTSITRVMEGGEKAFKLRKDKYGF